MTISKELLKGSTSLLVLSAINSSDMYGYEIVKKIKMASDDVDYYKGKLSKKRIQEAIKKGLDYYLKIIL